MDFNQYLEEALAKDPELRKEYDALCAQDENVVDEAATASDDTADPD